MPCNQGELSSVNFVRSKPFQMIAWIQKQWQQRTTLERACARLQATFPHRTESAHFKHVLIYVIVVKNFAKFFFW